MVNAGAPDCTPGRGAPATGTSPVVPYAVESARRFRNMFASFRTRLPMAAAVCLALAASVSAQTKVAVINLQKAVVDTAEIKKASAALEAKYRPRQEQMEKLQKEIQSLQQQLQNLQGKLTPQAEQDMVGQGQKKQRDLQRISEDLQADVDRERTDILNGSGQ